MVEGREECDSEEEPIDTDLQTKDKGTEDEHYDFLSYTVQSGTAAYGPTSELPDGGILYPKIQKYPKKTPRKEISTLEPVTIEFGNEVWKNEKCIGKVLGIYKGTKFSGSFLIVYANADFAVNQVKLTDCTVKKVELSKNEETLLFKTLASYIKSLQSQSKAPTQKTENISLQKNTELKPTRGRKRKTQSTESQSKKHQKLAYSDENEIDEEDQLTKEESEEIQLLNQLKKNFETQTKQLDQLEKKVNIVSEQLQQVISTISSLNANVNTQLQSLSQQHTTSQYQPSMSRFNSYNSVHPPQQTTLPPQATQQQSVSTILQQLAALLQHQ